MRFAEIDNIIGLISPDSLVFGGGGDSRSSVLSKSINFIS